jgi:hypothetical protein
MTTSSVRRIILRGLVALPLIVVCFNWNGTITAGDAIREAPPERPITPAERDHWAYRPIAVANPPSVADPRYGAHPIDCFLKSAMDREGVEPLPAAGKITLLRRVYFDLTGLPPTITEAQEFLDDHSHDAYEKLVDRLLASPAYGERWAQHWLDLARFAETDGFEHDLVRPNAWRYRDWVIAALNRDMPFDEFVRMQLAGDELRPGDPEAAIATGFLLCGPDMPDLNLQDERRHQVLNEMAATVGSVFLGLQVGCAQCHDHKYDPIRLHDFYRLRAFFESAEIFRDHPIPSAEQLAARAAAEAAHPEDRERSQRRVALEDLGRQRFREMNPDVRPGLKELLAELSQSERETHAQLVKELRQAAPLPELPLGRVMHPGAARSGQIFLRGDFRQPGPSVRCGFPRVLAPVEVERASDDLPDQPEQPRAKLAAWLTSRDNPLTARVIVNRVWQWHFGVGLAATASDFGLMGSPPNHPQLLDWLARRLVDDGWSLKKLHRLIVTSQAYQTASSPFDPQWSAEQTEGARAIWQRSSGRDPDNGLFWHRRRARLDAEAVRDFMLVSCGQLSTRRGGPGIRPPLAPEVTATLLKDQWLLSGDDEDHRRRGIYLFVRRNLRFPMFDVFDRPDTNASCALRHESTTASQSLVMLNSEFSLRCARWLAGAVIRSHPDNTARQLTEAYQRVFCRPATDAEIRGAQEFLDRQEERLRAEGRVIDSLALPDGPAPDENPHASAALVDFCLALLNSNEFLFVD